MGIQPSAAGGPSGQLLALERHLQEQAAELDRLKIQFLGNLTHEFRTPVNAILGLADLLLATSLSSEQRYYVLATRSCAEDLSEKLRATLEFSSLSLGAPRMEERPFDLVETLESALTALAGKAEAKRLELISNLDPDLLTVV